MESNQTPLFAKRYVHVMVRAPDVESLRTLSERMNQVQRQTFVKLYGNILDLAMIEFPAEAIHALVQYYDPPLRCFTFRDFQLLPTLEEFEKILGCPIGGRKPYLFSGQYPTVAKLATIVKIQENEVTKKQQSRNDVKGLPRGFLEKKAQSLADQGEWKAFMDLLALLIYGVVLFPRVGGIIDSAAIDAFLAFHNRKESPVVAILANTYCTLNLGYEKKKRTRILCCLPALYIWMASHVFNHQSESTCPIEDFRMCKVGEIVDWRAYLASMNRSTIRWYPKWKEVQGMVIKCGDFPNVPLMGMRGCINYNPVLATRQLGYPIYGPPPELAITPILCALDQDSSEMLKRIRKAWGKVVRRDKELKTSNSDLIESYKQWLENRVEEIKLPMPRTNLGVFGEVKEKPPLGSEEMEEAEEEEKAERGEVTRVCKECGRLREEPKASKRIPTTDGTNEVNLVSKQPPFELLLAGYLAHEFFTKGTLLGEPWASIQTKLPIEEDDDEEEESTEMMPCQKRRRSQ